MDDLLLAIQKILDVVGASPKYSKFMVFDRVELRKAEGSFFVY